MSADKSLRDISIRNSRTSRCVTREIVLSPQNLINSRVTRRYVVIVLAEYRWQINHSINWAASSALFRRASAETRFDLIENGSRRRFSMTLRNTVFILAGYEEDRRNMTYILRLVGSQCNREANYSGEAQASSYHS